MIKFSVREFKQKDVLSCCKIISETLGKVDAWLARKEFIQGLSGRSPRHALCKRFAVISEDKIIGLFGIYRFKTHPEKFIGVDWLALKKNYQRHGIGSKLMRQIEKMAKLAGGKTLFVWADRNAVDFYKKNNFRKTKIVLKPRDGFILLIKKL